MAKPAFHPPVCCTFRCDWIWNDQFALVCAHAADLAAFAAWAVCVCAHAVGLAAFAARARLLRLRSRCRSGDLRCAGATQGRRGHAYGPLAKARSSVARPKQNHSANPAARYLPGFHRPRLTLSGALNSDANLNARLQKPGSSQTRKADHASPQRDEQRHYVHAMASGDKFFRWSGRFFPNRPGMQPGPCR